MQPNSDFKELLNLFNQQQVRYLVVGGYAVIYHTEPRYTKDLDLWVSVDADNAERVYRALQQFGAPLVGITPQDFQVPGVVYQMGRPPARVDIIMGLKGVEFEEAWNARVAADFGGVTAPVLALSHLLINKQLAGRPQDLMDVESLLLAEKQGELSGE